MNAFVFTIIAGIIGTAGMSLTMWQLPVQELPTPE
jgi:hypothetical protein